MILDEYVYPWCAAITAPQKQMELIIINHDAYSHVMFSTLLLFIVPWTPHSEAMRRSSFLYTLVLHTALAIQLEAITDSRGYQLIITTNMPMDRKAYDWTQI
jgi:hypothetical protein